MNGADMKNFIDVGSPFASARIGEGEIFVSEVDESDGSITHFEPHIAVVNTISLDHKSLDELRTLFSGFCVSVAKNSPVPPELFYLSARENLIRDRFVPSHRISASSDAMLAILRLLQ